MGRGGLVSGYGFRRQVATVVGPASDDEEEGIGASWLIGLFCEADATSRTEGQPQEEKEFASSFDGDIDRRAGAGAMPRIPQCDAGAHVVWLGIAVDGVRSGCFLICVGIVCFGVAVVSR